MIQTSIHRRAGSKALVSGLVLAALMSASTMLTAKPAYAADFTVINTKDSGAGSLRQAIVDANATSGADKIKFNIPGTGVKTISPASELPKITDTVAIEGHTQPGSKGNTKQVGNDAVLNIELNGANVKGAPSGFATGLKIEAAGSRVTGMVINRFSRAGIELLGNDNSIEGNFIGTDPSGTVDRGNGVFGGVLVSGDSNSIGSNSSFGRNVISGNAMGIHLTDGATRNEVENNYVGTKKDGTSDLGNDKFGLSLLNASKNFIGGTGFDGTGRGEANILAFNGKGVRVQEVGQAATGNRLIANSIFANDDLGIDLGNDGPTANDTKDLDQGANGLQNKPALASATTSGSSTSVQGSLKSAPSKGFVIEFFSNPAGENEGKKFLGNKVVTTNANGVATFSFVPRQAVAVGQTVTATAMDSVAGNTSEFSAARVVVAS
jgi:parallel beta-helix repeat protein